MENDQDSQACFRKSRSTRDNICILKWGIKMMLREGHEGVITFIDYTAVFIIESQIFLDEALGIAGVHVQQSMPPQYHREELLRYCSERRSQFGVKKTKTAPGRLVKDTLCTYVNDGVQYRPMDTGGIPMNGPK